MSLSVTALEERLMSALAEQLEKDTALLRPDLTFRELEVDSLALIELIVTIESELDVDLLSDLDGIDQDSTLGEAAKIIWDRVAQGIGTVSTARTGADGVPKEATAS